MEMKVALKSIVTQRRRLADEVYDQLVEAIMNQQITAEDRLVQEKLAAELEISRTPVREALMRLEKEGVLMAAASGGFRLAQMDENEVKQLYQARAAIEGNAPASWPSEPPTRKSRNCAASSKMKKTSQN